MSLALSLLFGVAQIAAGAAVAWRLRPRKPWRSAGPSLLFAMCLWFISSGLIELLISGMELARVEGGGPSAEAFAVWRERADSVLLVVTVLLVLALLARPLLLRMHSYMAGPQERRRG